MDAVEFSSELPEEYADDLERLLYFNTLQGRAGAAIEHLVEKYGQPRIRADGGWLRVTVGDIPDVQTLFAIERQADADELVGVVIFMRQAEELAILHLAVAETFSSSGIDRESLLALRLVATVQGVGRRMQRIRSIVIYYPAGVPRRLRVDPLPASW
jgi:hypothetical protein